MIAKTVGERIGTQSLAPSTSARLSVLIAGCGGQSVGAGIIKALAPLPRYRLVAADMRLDCAALLNAEAAYQLPSARDPAYGKAVLRLCRQEGVQAILPGSHPDTIQLSKMAETLEDQGVRVIGNPWPCVKAATDKLKCMRLLARHGVPVPDTEPGDNWDSLVKRVGFPIILKPRWGQGSKGVRLVSSRREVALLLELHEISGDEVIVQEAIGSDGEEFTTGLILGFSGDLLGAVTLRRKICSGYTGTALCEPSLECETVARQAAAALGARGPFNAQMRLHRGVPTIFEINPRFSGTTPMRAWLGLNGPHLLIQSFLLGIEKISAPPRRGVLVLRDLRESYFEEADLEKIISLEDRVSIFPRG